MSLFFNCNSLLREEFHADKCVICCEDNDEVLASVRDKGAISLLDASSADAMAEPVTSSELDSIDDEDLLKSMLNKSEDLDYRRLIRSRLRVINKTKQTSANVDDGSNSTHRHIPAKVHPPKETRTASQSFSAVHITSDVVDGRRAESKQQQQPILHTTTSTSKTEQYSVTLRSVEPSLKSSTTLEKPKPKDAVLESVALRKVTDGKSLKPAAERPESTAKGDFLDGKKLRKVENVKTSNEATSKPAGQKKTDFLDIVTLRKVEGVKACGPTSASSSSTSSVRSTARGLTPKMAREHFKGMDATTESKVDGVSYKHRSISPNNIRQAMLDWCRFRVNGYENVNIVDFSESWSNGMAFCALVHSFFPDSFDYDTLDPSAQRQNLQLAFTTAEKVGGVFPLLDVEDMIQAGPAPDWKCIFTYVNSIYSELSASKKKTYCDTNETKVENEQVCEDNSDLVLDDDNTDIAASVDSALEE